MTHIEEVPLPRTAQHDAMGNHLPPHIPYWRKNPGAHTVKGSEVELDQTRRAQFAAHLAEHRRKGEPAIVVGEV